MHAHVRARIRHLIETGAYRELRAWLSGADRGLLSKSWAKLEAFDKLVAFKLMDAASAMEFYRRLPYEERYFLFCGHPLQALAPILETVSASARRLFVQLPAGSYRAMLQDLSGGRP